MSLRKLKLLLIVGALALGVGGALVNVGSAPRVVVDDDYLSASLRAEVENLKRDLSRAATDDSNIDRRADVLWRWANAYALREGVLPVELPLIIALVKAYPRTRFPTRAARSIDRFVRELQVREERPDAIGSLESDVAKPFLAGSFQTIRQTYTVGTMPMVPGGGILVAKHFLADHGAFQTSDPRGDNYVTVSCSHPGAKFRQTSVPLSGMHGGFRRSVDALAFKLEGPELRQGATITITYGDRSGGSRGFRVQSYSNDRFPLPLDHPSCA